jgi:hypothetical protein
VGSNIPAASVSLSSYTAQSTSQNVSITAMATCGSVNFEKLCISSVAIATSYYKVEELDVENIFAGGRVVIEIADGLQATHISCEKIGYILNGLDPTYRVEPSDGWGTLELPPYSANGNRIYLRDFTDASSFTCIISNQ